MSTVEENGAERQPCRAHLTRHVAHMARGTSCFVASEAIDDVTDDDVVDDDEQKQHRGEHSPLTSRARQFALPHAIRPGNRAPIDDVTPRLFRSTAGVAGERHVPATIRYRRLRR